MSRHIGSALLATGLALSLSPPGAFAEESSVEIANGKAKGEDGGAQDIALVILPLHHRLILVSFGGVNRLEMVWHD